MLSDQAAAHVSISRHASYIYMLVILVGSRFSSVLLLFPYVRLCHYAPLARFKMKSRHVEANAQAGKARRLGRHPGDQVRWGAGGQPRRRCHSQRGAEQGQNDALGEDGGWVRGGSCSGTAGPAFGVDEGQANSTACCMTQQEMWAPSHLVAKARVG